MFRECRVCHRVTSDFSKRQRARDDPVCTSCLKARHACAWCGYQGAYCNFAFLQQAQGPAWPACTRCRAQPVSVQHHVFLISTPPPPPVLVPVYDWGAWAYGFNKMCVDYP